MLHSSIEFDQAFDQPLSNRKKKIDPDVPREPFPGETDEQFLLRLARYQYGVDSIMVQKVDRGDEPFDPEKATIVEYKEGS